MMLPTQRQTTPNHRLLLQALLEAGLKLDPRQQVRQPVILAIEVVSLAGIGLWLWALLGGTDMRVKVVAGVVALWLSSTVLFTNFADALAKGRRETQADSWRQGHRKINIRWLKLHPPYD